MPKDTREYFFGAINDGVGDLEFKTKYFLVVENFKRTKTFIGMVYEYFYFLCMTH